MLRAVGGSEGRAALPPCGDVGPATAAPAAVRALPFPERGVLSWTQRRGRYVLAGGALPLSLRDARDFYRRELPRAGYRLAQGDAERYEAETGFAGHGIRGRLKLNALPGCPGATLFQLAVRAVSPVPQTRTPTF